MRRRLVVLSDRAAREIDAAERWWIRHRDKAPHAFEEDLRQAFSTLRDAAEVGHPVRSRRYGTIRRFQLTRIRYWLYYRATDDMVEILALWHMSRRPLRL